MIASALPIYGNDIGTTIGEQNIVLNRQLARVVDLVPADPSHSTQHNWYDNEFHYGEYRYDDRKDVVSF